MSEIRYETDFIEACKVIWEDLREEVQLGQQRALQKAS
jgi:NitT/TauT family transport system ATP-binding protein